MSNWSVYSWNGSSWISDGTIARPHANLTAPKESNMQIVQLQDGSEGSVCPETKSRFGDIQFYWSFDDKTIYDKIQGYIDNNTYIKILTHDSGIEYIGRFMSIRPAWLIGQEPDKWHIEVTFHQFE